MGTLVDVKYREHDNDNNKRARITCTIVSCVKQVNLPVDLKISLPVGFFLLRL